MANIPNFWGFIFSGLQNSTILQLSLILPKFNHIPDIIDKLIMALSCYQTVKEVLFLNKRNPCGDSLLTECRILPADPRPAARHPRKGGMVPNGPVQPGTV